MGCSRAGETAGISPFVAAAVLDRALAGTRRWTLWIDRSSTPAADQLPEAGSGAGGFAGAMPGGSPRGWVLHGGIPL